MKRIFDFTVALIGLILLSPLFIVIGLLIKFDDRGPVFFRQVRVGRGGKVFDLYKFRSMRMSKEAENGIFEPGNSSRVTATGKFLRKTKLDELPQLINVLRGDMSIVGPRPEVPKWVETYPDKWERVLTLRPGITDNASIIYRNEERILAESSDPETTYMKDILPKKLMLYEEYVLNHSFIRDLNLIFKTLFSIAKMNN